MAVLEAINKDFKEAYLAKDMDKKNFLGLVKSEIKRGEDDSDEAVIKVIKKFEKSLNEVGGESAKIELGYIKPYIPQLLGESQTTILVGGIISNGASNIGMVMKEINSKYKGKVDNKLVSKIAKEILN